MQLAMLLDAIRTTFKDPSASKKVTSVFTLVDVMIESEVVRNMLGEVDKVLKLYMTFPVTSVTAERSFSSVRCIKTFMQSCMTQLRLNNLLMLYVQSSETDEL